MTGAFPGRRLVVLLLVPLVLAGLALTPRGASAAPANPEASPAASRLLDYLGSVEGRSILSGQSNYLENPDEYVDKVNDLTGSYPAIAGYELGPIGGESAALARERRQRVTDRALAYWRAGGIVEMHWHATWPGAPAYDWDHVHGGPFPDGIVEKSVTPGTPEHTALLADLDLVAGYLTQLRDAGVPVLWRPYHEMNGGWFWWGQSDRYADLWRLMHSRFTGEHGLDNLLWVWSPNQYDPQWAGPYADYFPGEAYVDIAGIDSYDPGYPNDDYESLLPVAGDRPVGYTENGDLPDPARLRSEQPRMSFFLTWNKYIVNGDGTAPRNTPEWVRSVYAHPDVLTRDELPDLTAPVTPPSPSPTPSASPSPSASPRPTASPGPGLADGSYTLTSQTSGRRLDVAGASSADGTQVWTWSANSSCAQRWRVEAVADGYSRLVNECGGKVLDVAGAATAEGGSVHQWGWHGGANQQWRIAANADGSHTLTARHSGLALDVQWAGTADGTAVQQWTPNGTAAQRWTLERLP